MQISVSCLALHQQLKPPSHAGCWLACVVLSSIQYRFVIKGLSFTSFLGRLFVELFSGCVGSVGRCRVLRRTRSAADHLFTLRIVLARICVHDAPAAACFPSCVWARGWCFFFFFFFFFFFSPRFSTHLPCCPRLNSLQCSSQLTIVVASA